MTIEGGVEDIDNRDTFVSDSSDMIKMLIEWYKKSRTWMGVERYKWEAYKQFNEFFYTEEKFSERMKKAFLKSYNLLNSYRYYPLGMFCSVIPQFPKLLEELYDERSSRIKDRIELYMKGFKDAVNQMKMEGCNGWEMDSIVSTYQDVHAISVYLSMRYPDKYYIYKYGIFRDFSQEVDYKIKQVNPVERMLEYFSMCEAVKKEILKEKEFIGNYNEWLKQKDFQDPNYNLLTQDFIYSSVRHRERYSMPHDVICIESKDVSKIIIEHKASKGGKKIDYIKMDERKHGLGEAGELWVMRYEENRIGKGRVRHISMERGDGAGYDIESVEDDGVTPRYIEVKTTTGGIDTPFFFSNNELLISKQLERNYYIYRLYYFGKHTKLLIMHGSLADLAATPVSYKCIVGGNKE